MAKGVTSRASSYRTNKRLTKAQKLIKSKQSKSRQSAKNKSSMWDYNSKGTGKYAKKATKPLTRGQAYRLERQSLRNEGMAINAKPEMIRASGMALAENLAPGTASFGAGAGVSLGIKDSSNSQIRKLTDGGAAQADTSNDEEIRDTLPGGSVIR